MKIKARQYPHPVLSRFSDDFQDHCYTAEVKVSAQDFLYEITAVHTCTSEYLKDLIVNGDAEYALHIECGTTWYRELHSSQEETQTIRIASMDVDGRVEVIPLIIAAKTIVAYTSQEMNPIFNGYTFEVSCGDVIAVGQNQSFSADKHLDALKRVPSIFTIERNTSQDAAEIEINAESDRVVIHLSEENFSLYNKLKRSETLFPVISALVIAPALTMLIQKMKEVAPDSSLSELRWFRMIMNKIQDPAILHAFEAHEITQRLIDNPLSRGLKSLDQFAHSEEESA